MEIRELLQSFVQFVKSPEERAHPDLLAICDRLFSAYQSVSSDAFDERSDLAAPPEKDWPGAHRIVAQSCPFLGHYNTPEHFLSSGDAVKCSLGWAVDDCAGVLLEFEEILWRFEHTSEDDALWHFRFGYSAGWGNNLRNLQYYLWRYEAG